MRYVTGYDHDNNFKVVEAKEGFEIDSGEWDEYIFQHATDALTAEQQHDAKFLEWQHDNNTGNEIKETY